MSGESRITDCERCEGPGFCERHAIYKSAHWAMLCRTRPDYFTAWEQGRGPGQWGAPSPEQRAKREAASKAQRIAALAVLRERFHATLGASPMFARCMAGELGCDALIPETPACGALGGSCRDRHSRWLQAICEGRCPRDPTEIPRSPNPEENPDAT